MAVYNINYKARKGIVPSGVKKMKVFKKVKAYIAGEGLKETDIVFEKKIQSFQSEEVEKEIVIPKNCVVLPGFIDEHIHGAGGADISNCSHEVLKQVAQTIAKSGTTAFLPTTVSQTAESMERTLTQVCEYMKSGEKEGAEVLGTHLEGPFLAHRYKGGMREENLLLPSVEMFDYWYKTSGETVKMITLAPELAGAEKLIKHLKQLGVTVSIGHSAATYQDVIYAKECGASCVTHTYNAQSPLHHREIGVLGSALLCDDLTCELIADTIHVSVPAMQILVKNKPSDKVVLITDSLRAQGLPQGVYEAGGQTIVVDGTCCRLQDGTLAGTVIPMNGMIRNMVEKVGVPFTQAVDYATINPAQNLKIAQRKGSIAIGKDADFAVLDENFDVYMTIRSGEVIYSRDEI